MANLLVTMEYLAAFITQVVSMMLNNAVYFLFWVIFFTRFKEVRGWGLEKMFHRELRRCENDSAIQHQVKFR